MDRTRRTSEASSRPAAPCTLPLAVLALSALTSCAVERTLKVQSEPPGAIIRLDNSLVRGDDGELARTPVKLRYDDYGTRRITLYLDGYRIQSRRVRLRPPWYLRFPIDLVTEVLLPVGWKDRRSIQFELEPESGTVTEPDLEGVLQRAEFLRRAGVEGPKPIEQPTETLEIQRGASGEVDPNAGVDPFEGDRTPSDGLEP